jgi:hypothetical protein
LCYAVVVDVLVVVRAVIVAVVVTAVVIDVVVAVVVAAAVYFHFASKKKVLKSIKTEALRLFVKTDFCRMTFFNLTIF